MASDVRRIRGYRWEVKGLGEWIKKLRAEPMPEIKLTGKLKGLDMVKDLEYRQKVIQDYLDELVKEYMKSRGLNMTTVLMPICLLCKNYDEGSTDKDRCKAYPRGVPQDILFSEHDHRKPFGKEKKRDKEPILFEPINKAATEYAETRCLY